MNSNTNTATYHAVLDGLMANSVVESPADWARVKAQAEAITKSLTPAPAASKAIPGFWAESVPVAGLAEYAAEQKKKLNGLGSPDPLPAPTKPVAAKGGAGGKAPKAKKSKESEGPQMYKKPTKKELKEAKKPRQTTQWVVYTAYMQEEFKKDGLTFAGFAEKMAEISRRWREEVPDEDKVVDPPGKWQRRANRRTAANLAEWEEKQGIEA